VNDSDKIEKEEAKNKGIAIIGNLAEMYDLIDWDDSEDAYLDLKFCKSGRVEIFTSKDAEADLGPTVFDLKEIIRKDKTRIEL
tara:strand:- start:385 stop:633 length:249 start_codon:yes stop_codon:yes gene_type:complete